MNSKDRTSGVRLRFNQKDQQFPEKLYDVANDGYLVRWNGCGTAIQVDDPDKFENEVMKCYPGFLQIPSFANFRRLFREYSFRRTLLDDGLTLEFSHPYFAHGFREGLSEIRTRRKSFSKPSIEISAFQRDVNLINDDESQGGLRYRTRRSRLTKSKQNKNNNSDKQQFYSNSSTFVINDGFQGDETNDSEQDKSDERIITEQPDSCESTEPDTVEKRNTFNSIKSDIMRLFIRNEFTFEDFCVWAERNQADFEIGTSMEDVYDAINRQNNYINQSQTDPLSQGDTGVTDRRMVSEPCGQCRCCRAYQSIQYTEDISDSFHGDLSCNVPDPVDSCMSYEEQETSYFTI